MKYIDNDKNKGLIYDWKKIRKEFGKLKIPKDVFNPCHAPFETCKYFVGISERSIGKSTNWLLLGMIMNKVYGTQIQYIRQDEKHIAPKSSKNMFDVIIDYGYVPKLTDDKYNSVIYKSRRWYYAKVNEEGIVEDKAPEHFCFMTDIMHATQLKSSYNAPLGDFILFDEFINTAYYPNEFVLFADLVKTIIRDRQSPIVIMQANTINKESEYFNELGVYDEVHLLGKGENTIVTTDKGTRIYLEWISLEKTSAKKVKHNMLYFGFDNTRLASITGDDWAIPCYPHIPDTKDNFEVLARNIYISHSNKYIRLTIGKHEKLGLIVLCNKALYVYEDSVILSLVNQIDDNRVIYGDGTRDLKYGNLFKLIWVCKTNNKMYFQNNDIGHFVENYLSLLTIKRK